jgi:hypothetical protein
VNRTRRRALLDAHYQQMEGSACSCDECGSQIEESFIGTSLAVAGKIVCRSCALDLVDDTAARPTMEMPPISDAEAIAQLRLRSIA